MGTRWSAGFSMSAVCLAWSVSCYAAEPLSGVLACRTVSDPAARLACFDRETAALDARSAPAPTAAHPVAPLDPKLQFGLPLQTIKNQEIAADIRPADAAKIEAHISQVSQTPNGRAILTLDNDQVWRQLVADVDLLAKSGDPVTISRALLGSYWLEETKSGRGCKVTRIR
jgi:hypothetical protein